MNCTNSCPKGLNPAKAIGSIKKCLQQAKSLFIQLHHENNSAFRWWKSFAGESKEMGRFLILLLESKSLK